MKDTKKRNLYNQDAIDANTLKLKRMNFLVLPK